MYDCATRSERVRVASPWSLASSPSSLRISRQAYHGARPQPTTPPAIRAKIRPQRKRSRARETAIARISSISSRIVQPKRIPDLPQQPAVEHGKLTTEDTESTEEKTGAG